MRSRKDKHYVCAGVNSSGNLCSLQCAALNKVDAIRNFEHKYDFSPEEVFGPFSNRRENSKRKLDNVKFSTISYKGVYKGWNVVATKLKNPENYVFVMFDFPIDLNIKTQKPPDNEVVHFTKIKVDTV